MSIYVTLTGPMFFVIWCHIDRTYIFVTLTEPVLCQLTEPIFLSIDIILTEPMAEPIFLVIGVTLIAQQNCLTATSEEVFFPWYGKKSCRRKYQ